jgi:hypothetical protein
MKKAVAWIIFFLLTCGVEKVYAQSIDAGSFPDTAFSVPSIIGSPRSKGLIVRQETVLGYRIRSQAGQPNIPEGNGYVDYNSRWEFKLRLPIISSPDLIFAMGINYEIEEYDFRDEQNQSYFFYNKLERKSLKSAGGTLYIIKPFRGRAYFLFRGSADINGDYGYDEQPSARFLRLSATPMIGWKINDNLSYAIGLAYGYKFGRELVVPVLSYNRNFNKKWTLEATLPTRIRVRYNYNPRTFFYGVTELNGANYNITLPDPVLAGIRPLYLQKAEIRHLIIYERELYDWLWVGMETGMRTNINFNLTSTPRSRRDVVVRNRLGNAFLFSFSIFVVPPKRFVKDK